VPVGIPIRRARSNTQPVGASHTRTSIIITHPLAVRPMSGLSPPSGEIWLGLTALPPNESRLERRAPVVVLLAALKELAPELRRSFSSFAPSGSYSSHLSLTCAGGAFVRAFAHCAGRGVRAWVVTQERGAGRGDHTVGADRSVSARVAPYAIRGRMTHGVWIVWGSYGAHTVGKSP
jgi:hypothetical protein